MLTEQDIEVFFASYLAAQSLDALRPDFRRWIPRLRSEGVTSIPSPFSAAPEDAHAMNLLALFARQASDHHDASMEHSLRNIAGVRRYKP